MLSQFVIANDCTGRHRPLPIRHWMARNRQFISLATSSQQYVIYPCSATKETMLRSKFCMSKPKMLCLLHMHRDEVIKPCPATPRLWD